MSLCLFARPALECRTDGAPRRGVRGVPGPAALPRKAEPGSRSHFPYGSGR